MTIRKLILIIFTLYALLLITGRSISAATPSPKPTLNTGTPSVSPSNPLIDKLKQIETLKEKVATKVAEIRAQDQAAIYGSVNKISANSISVNTSQGNRTISYSEDTIFYVLTETGRTDSSIKKITEGDNISVFGYLADDKTTLAAKYIYIELAYFHVIGKIADIDKDNFTITVNDKSSNIVTDIETYTKISTVGADGIKLKIGFSKLKTGDLVHLSGLSTKKDTGRVSAYYIIVIPPPKEIGPTPTGSINPSPTKQSSPSATPKITIKVSPTQIP